MNTGITLTITGTDAIEYARTIGCELNKYADPTEDARFDITIEEAEDVARDDAHLIWASLSTERAEDWLREQAGDLSDESLAAWFGEYCDPSAVTTADDDTDTIAHELTDHACFGVPDGMSRGEADVAYAMAAQAYIDQLVEEDNNA